MAKKTLSAQAKETVIGALQVAFDEARAEFEADKTEQAAAWKKELARMKEEDLYQFNKEKRDREDALEVELAQRTSAVSEREVKVKEREIAVGDAEKTISELQRQVDNIPAIVSKAEAAAAAKGEAEAKKEAEAEIRLLQAENDADKKVLEHALTSVKAVVANQEKTIETLKEELAAANARVSEIATNAVTAAGQSKVTVQTATNGK